MAGGTLFIKVLPEKGAELAIQKAIERGGQQAEGSSKDSGSRFGIGFAAAAGVAIGKGLQQAAALEQVEVGLTTMLGSAGAARDMLGELTDFARDTPFEMQGLAANARQLLGVGAAAEDVIPTLQVLGDASAALGLSQEQMDRVLRAVTQSMAKGKFQAEEMMQMAEAGIPIYDLMARAVGKTVPEMQEMAKNGELLSGDVLPKLLAVMQEDYAGGMVAQSKTLNGVLSTFKDDINLGLADAVQSLLPLLKDLLPSAGKAATGVIEAFGNGLKLAALLAYPLIQGLDALLEGFGSLPGPIQTAVVAALLLGRVMGGFGLIGVIKMLWAMATAMYGAAAGATTLRGALTAMGLAAAGAAGRAGLSGLASALMGGIWGAAIIGIGLLANTIIDIAHHAENARKSVEALVGDVTFADRGAAAAAIRDLRDSIRELDSTQGGWTGPRFLNEIFGDFDEKIDASRDKIDELVKAQFRYTRNSRDLAEALGITVGQLEQLALAEGLDLNLLAGDSEDVQLFADGLRGANAAVEAGFDPTSALGTAMTTLGDEAATAADKADALKDALAALAGDRIGVLQAAADWQESLANLAEALQTTDKDGKVILDELALAAVDAAGNINLTSEAGRGLQDAALGAAEKMRNMAAAARDEAIANGDMAGSAAAAGAAADAARQQFIDQAVQLGLTREQAEGLANTYGLIPGAVVTAVATPGMTQAQLDTARLDAQLTSLPPNTPVKVTSLTDEAKQRLVDLGFVVTTLPDGQVTVTAPNAGTVGKLIDDIANRKRTAAIELTYVMPTRRALPGVLGRSGLTLADGGRLEFYASGGKRALTPMRANWAAEVPADTWRVIGDRAKGREWFIPEDAPNTLPLLRDAAAAHGLQLVRAMAEGGLLGSRPVTVPASNSRTANYLITAPSPLAEDILRAAQEAQRDEEFLRG